MKITKKWLRDRGACYRGFYWFNKNFPNGFDTETDRWPTRSACAREWLCDTIIVLLFDATYGPVYSPRSVWATSDLAREFLLRVSFHQTISTNLAIWPQIRNLRARVLNRALREVARKYEERQ